METTASTDTPALAKGDEALDAVTRVLRRFLYFSRPEQYDAVALWIAHSYVFRAFKYTPRLAFTSDSPGCGKTMALELTGLMCPDVLQAAGMTAPSLRIAIQNKNPTIALDETDGLFGATGRRHEDVRTILNAGFESKGTFITATGNGTDIKEWRIFGPVMFAGIGGLPATLQDRAISVKMTKPPASERPEKYRSRLHEDLIIATGKALGEWVRSVAPELGDYVPDEIAGVELRTENIWEPLLVTGLLAGGTWPERARAACSALVTGSGSAESVTPPPDVVLLADIREVFRGARMPSSALVRALMARSPWNGLWNEVTAANQLAGMLRPLGIVPRVMRVDGQARRSYARADFAEAWSVLLPAAGEESAAA